MPYTLSSLPINADTPNATLDYQRIMLAEMGIPLWVSHTTPVQTIDLTQFDSQNLTGQTVNEDPVIQQSFSQETALTPVLELPTPQDKLINLSKHDKTELSQIENDSARSAIATPENVTGITYSLACMRVNRWILLADNQYLSAHPAEQQLWQTIAHNMKAEQTMLNFPIVNANSSQPATHQMRDITSAQMTFIGFIHAELLKVESLQIGAISPLPEVIEDTDLNIINIGSIQRLPYLSEMLIDPRQKRQLWELIKKP